MAKLKTVDLALPATTEELRKLEIGNVVYLSGRVEGLGLFGNGTSKLQLGA